LFKHITQVDRFQVCNLNSRPKDRRNSYGESDKGSRKSIPKNKRSSIHAERSKEVKLNQLSFVTLDDDSISEIENEVVSETKLKRVESFRKCPDQPLKDHVAQRQKKREINYGRKKYS